MQLPFEIERNVAAISQEVASLGAEVIEIAYRRGAGRPQLIITADKAGGITLDDCAEINRRVGQFLDRLSQTGVSDPALDSAYDLEVVSPGLDRPLKSAKDFSRVVGEMIRVAFNRGDGSSATWTGKLLESDAESFDIQLKDGAVKKIALNSVTHAVRQIQFGAPKPKKK